MNKIKNNTNKKKKLPIGTLLLIFLATAVVVTAGLYLFAPKPETQNDQPEENTAQEEPMKLERPGDEEEVKTPIQNEGEDPNEKDEITGSIISTNFVGYYTLRIRNNIDQYVSGTCELEMTYTGTDTPTLKTSHTEKVDIIDSASTSTCEGFDVDVEPLEAGPYSITITINTTDNRKGVIKGEVELQ